eukprot:TRINITY_DN224_c0_g1_i1.p2 TRINITY_DN224_c0_g1~~TRINITY_DN224_c0_g1_i1.p2  ORF type:complete len:242 (-),score=1.04 TRINITY_DN224_c0_g1_i1:114-839(-)
MMFLQNETLHTLQKSMNQQYTFNYVKDTKAKQEDFPQFQQLKELFNYLKILKNIYNIFFSVVKFALKLKQQFNSGIHFNKPILEKYLLKSGKSQKIIKKSHLQTVKIQSRLQILILIYQKQTPIVYYFLYSIKISKQKTKILVLEKMTTYIVLKFKRKKMEKLLTIQVKNIKNVYLGQKYQVNRKHPDNYLKLHNQLLGNSMTPPSPTLLSMWRRGVLLRRRMVLLGRRMVLLRRRVVLFT